MMENTNNTLRHENEEKTALKGTIARGTWAVTVNLLIMNFIVFLAMLGRIIFNALQNVESTDNPQATLNSIFKNIDTTQYVISGIGYLISVGIGLLIVGLLMKKYVSIKEMFASDKKMTLYACIVCFFVFMSVQLPVNLANIIIEKILNQFGSTIEMGVNSSSSTLSMALYFSFAAPIAEELIYRGYIMKSLKKYGANFAIVISSILFGLMHMNPTQSFFAIFVGLVLGYVAMNYSIKWSILFHIINNAVYTVGLSYVTEHFFTDKQSTVISLVLDGIIFLVGMILLKKNWGKVKEYIQENKAPKNYYKWAFSTKILLAFVIVCFISAFM